MEFQRLINECRIASKYNRLVSSIYEEALNRHYAYMDNMIMEDCEDADKEEVLRHIQEDDYEVDNFEKFCAELNNNSRDAFLTKYDPETFKEKGVHCYSVPGYEIGFALMPSGDDVDIISVHNNSNVRGIGGDLIESAKRLGGTTLDHFEGFLSDFYSSHGFEQNGEPMEWNDEYAPKNWDYEKYGRPNIIFRKLKKEDE